MRKGSKSFVETAVKRSARQEKEDRAAERKAELKPYPIRCCTDCGKRYTKKKINYSDVFKVIPGVCPVCFKFKYLTRTANFWDPQFPGFLEPEHG